MDQVKKKTFLHKLARIVLKTVLIILLLFLLIGILVQTTPVQNIIRKKTVAWLEKKLQTKVEIGRIYIGLPGKLTLENIYVEDKQKDTLLSGGRLYAGINLYKLIFHNDLDLRKLELENMTVKIKRQLPDTIYNFQFVADVFNPADTTINAANDTLSNAIAIPSLVANNVRLVYKDVITGTEMNAWVHHLDTRVDKFDGGKLIFDLPYSNIDGLTAAVYQVKPLVTPDPLSKDIAEAIRPGTMILDLKDVNLKNVNVDYRNDVLPIV